MNKAAVYHRPESEFAYLYTKDVMHVRVRTGRDDVAKVELVYGDPYDWKNTDKPDAQYWENHVLEMHKMLSTATNDYFEVEVSVPTRRMDYLFTIEGLDGEKVVLTDQGAMPFDETFTLFS